METFKQLMGFLLLGTVVFIFSYLDWPYVVPTLGFLFAIWFGCWWVARTPATAETSAKARAWVETATIIAAAWFLMFAGTRGILPSKWAFGSTLDVMNSRFEMAVEERGALRDSSTLVANHGGPPSTEADSASASPVAVLVDCTADWCPTCKVLEATVLESDAVRRAILANGVVTLRADWTHSAPEVTKLLKMLGSQQVPQVAIFSGSDPNHPRVFRDGYTQQQLLDAIEQAGTAKSGDNSQPPGISKM
jgi:thiol:disulfide interchange protein DsbD